MDEATQLNGTNAAETPRNGIFFTPISVHENLEGNRFSHVEEKMLK